MWGPRDRVAHSYWCSLSVGRPGASSLSHVARLGEVASASEGSNGLQTHAGTSLGNTLSLWRDTLSRWRGQDPFSLQLLYAADGVQPSSPSSTAVLLV